jgi:adenylate kinase
LYPVVYLTGAPAAGKSSLCQRLLALRKDLAIFEYGARLTTFLNEKHGSKLQQSELREKSSGIASPNDIAAVDELLINFVATNRTRSPVIIDSHPVTKESYGFRITPYSIESFRRLAPTQIWMLFTDPEVALGRINSNAQGRPLISLEEARFHTMLQSVVATTYGIGLGTPVHFFDSNCDLAKLAFDLAKRLIGQTTEQNL